MAVAPDLPVRVLDHPHWRVVIRPTNYKANRLASLSAGFDLVDKTSVRLRGWPYPSVDREDKARVQGNDWIGSWAEFMGHSEYWRLYLSGQFVHLFAVREATELRWREKLLGATQAHLRHVRDLEWSAIPGFLDVTNFIYCMTEIFEFATRLAERGEIPDSVDVDIRLRQIKGFVLTTSIERMWSRYRAASEAEIGRTWTYETADLLARRREHAVEAIAWFFERFGWLDPPRQSIQADQQALLERRW